MDERRPTKPAALVFDLGGVVVDWDPRHLYRRIIADESEREWFLREVCSLAWVGEQDGARSWAEGEALLIARFPAQRARIEAFRARWLEMLNGPIQGTLDILQRLKADGHRLIALSNWAADTFAESLPHLPFLDVFEGLVISGREGVRKPDPRIFALTAARYGLTPQRSIFVDDMARNVEAAATAGFDAILFSNPEQLAADLRQRGLL